MNADSSPSPRPPVVIMNLGHSALGIARALKPLHPRIVVVDARPWAHGVHSRHFEFRRMADSGTEAPRLLEQLLALAAELGGRPVLFPTRDLDVVFVRTYRSALEPAFRLCQASDPAIDAITDKYRTTAVAAELGVSVPRTLTLGREAGDAYGIPEDFRYPAIIKAVHAHEARLEGRWQAAGGKKGHVAGERAEAVALAGTLVRLGIDWYMQEYVPGPVDRLWICAGYIDRQGRPLATYTAHKTLQIPEQAGLGIVVETLDRPELVAMTLKVLEGLGYTGIFEAEYKVDHDGMPRLLEINPRHWDQHELGTRCNANVSELAYLDLAGQAPEARPYRYRYAQWLDDASLFRLLMTARLGILAGVYGRRDAQGNAPERLYSLADGTDPGTALEAHLRTLGGLFRSALDRVAGIFTGGARLSLLATFLLAALCAQPVPAADGKADDRMEIIGARVHGLAPVEREDLALMEPVCALIMKHEKIGDDNPKLETWFVQLKNSPLFDLPQYQIAKGTISFHHYCWAEIARNRASREMDPGRRTSLLKYAVENHDFVLRHTEWRPKDWPYEHQLHYLMGLAYLQMKDYANAVKEIEVALASGKRPISNYHALADAYLGMGNRQKALDAVAEGLRHYPDRTGLKERYRELGGKLPYPEPYPSPPPPPESPEATKPPPAEMPEAPKPAPSPEVQVAPKPSPAPTQPGRGSCRFCVEETK